MSSIATFVFIDFETTGLPAEEHNKTKITEMSMVAVKRNHLLETRAGSTPRVQHKLTLCLNPRKFVSPVTTEITGLCNILLEHEPEFNMTVANMINSFLGLLTKPVCLIAQNGIHFDFPIMKRHFENLETSLSHDIMCADCYHAFYDILEGKQNSTDKVVSVTSLISEEVHSNKEVTLVNNSLVDNSTELYTLENTLNMKLLNEQTPKKVKEKKEIIAKKCKRRFPWNPGPKPKISYKLKDIYERQLNRPALDAHRAENDCLMALECSVTLRLLVLTGALWGCTNPFIRQGTKGICEVKSETRLGQAWAEISFLLGNWRYLLPWLVNQMGSLVYLAAVQRAPLSLAVPVANSLAFAFTAVVGAIVGAEEPLDKGSILGIVLIVAGISLCCLD